MDAIFKALGDDTRRRLLDSLRAKDGQTLIELERGLADAGVELTRHGVMKHLRVLENASLVVTRRAGRHKHHHLNAVPIQEVMDRWVEPFRHHAARGLIDLKNSLEGLPMTETPDFVLETHIRTTPEKLWHALTDPGTVSRYYIARSSPDSNWEIGSSVVYRGPDGAMLIDGKVLTFDPPRRLEMSFVPQWLDDRTESRVVYEIEAAQDGPRGGPGVCKLTLLHFGFTPAQEGVRTGWMWIVSNLKSLLETGEPLQNAA